MIARHLVLAATLMALAACGSSDSPETDDLASATVVSVAPVVEVVPTSTTQPPLPAPSPVPSPTPIAIPTPTVDQSPHAASPNATRSPSSTPPPTPTAVAPLPPPAPAPALSPAAPDPPVRTAALVANGAEVYTLSCARCHGDTGAGTFIADGLIGTGANYGVGGLVAELTSGHPYTFGFADELSAEEIDAVATYVLATFG